MDQIINIDIISTFEKSGDASKILGIPIDKNVYNNRDDIKVETTEDFNILSSIGSYANLFYVVDLDQFIQSNKTQINDIINDNYQYELFYYGFVIKFWPQLNRIAFQDYIQYEVGLFQKYPELAKSKKNLTHRQYNEQSIINTNYKLSNKIAKISKFINTTITQAILTNFKENEGSSSGVSAKINIRNLFDKLSTSVFYPQINAYIEFDNKKFTLKKNYIKNQSEIAMPNNMKSGLVIAISIKKEDQERFYKKNAVSTIENELSRFIYFNILPNGQYFIKCIWDEQDEYDFDKTINTVKHYVDPVIEIINGFKKYIFQDPNIKLEKITKYNIHFKSLFISILWKKVISESIFKFLKLLWDPYIKAGIVSVKGIQQSGTYELMWHKGIYQFDMGIITRILSMFGFDIFNNYYEHLTNDTFYQKWNQQYSGRLFKMSHRITDIKFEIINIKEDEFRIFYNYIAAFIATAMCNEKLKTKLEKSFQFNTEVKKLRKLMETDPELYNLKKHGSNKVYSIMCQNPRQPVIYTQDEVDNMSDKQLKSLNKYWNFTLKKPAYYGCPSKKYSHFSYIVGVHPKSYCLPCCGKTEAVEHSKKMLINNVCYENYKFDTTMKYDDLVKYKKGKKREIKFDDFIEKSGEKSKGFESELEKSKFKHIMNYGKKVNSGRLSKLPPSAIKQILLNNLQQSLDDQSIDVQQQGIYILGVEQNIGSINDIGLLYSIATTLNMTIDETVGKFIKVLKENPKLFNTLLRGTLIQYFTSNDDFINAMNNIFNIGKSKGKAINVYEYIKFNKWNDLFIELSASIFDINILIFEDIYNKGQSTNLVVPSVLQLEQDVLIGKKMANFLLLFKQGNDVYPIYIIDSNEYFRTGDITKKIFNTNDAIMEQLLIIIKTKKLEESEQLIISKQIDIIKLKDFGKKILYKFINKSNSVYAAIIEYKKDQLVYVPLLQTPNVSDGIETIYQVFDRNKYKLSPETLLNFIHDINKFLKKQAESPALDSKTTDDEFAPISGETSEIKLLNKLVLGNKLIGFESNNNYYYYISDIATDAAIDDTTDLMKSLGIKILKYDPYEINKKIISYSIIDQNIKEDNRTKKLGISLYNNNLYSLFLLEFINYINNERNVQLRQKIFNLIKDTNFKEINNFAEKLENLVENESDYDLIIKQINANKKGTNQKIINSSIEVIKQTNYNFDKMTINNLKKMKINKVITELRAIVKDFTTIGKISDNIKFQNMYMSCSDINTFEKKIQEYCDKNKLIVESQKILDNLIHLLAMDIKSPLKLKYIFSSVFSYNIINYFDFIKRPHENISILAQ